MTDAGVILAPVPGVHDLSVPSPDTTSWGCKGDRQSGVTRGVPSPHVRTSRDDSDVDVLVRGVTEGSENEVPVRDGPLPEVLGEETHPCQNK